MEKKTHNTKHRFLLLFLITVVLSAACIFFFTYIVSTQKSIQDSNKLADSDLKSFHIIITGTYENQQFLEQVYFGALRYADSYQAVLELYVPKSQAESVSLQNLLDYCSYVNADGIIAFIDSPEENLKLKTAIYEKEIPIVTTGTFSSNIPQISFIGNSNWELGKKIADEILYFLPSGGKVHIITDTQTANSNYSNLLNSLQSTLMNSNNITTDVIPELNEKFDFKGNDNLFVCLNDDDTIKTAQILSERFGTKHYDLIGFANNEICQLYLKKRLISELIFLDPQKIGETAITELFEYKNRGYANSYIASDVQISRARR